jgi:hypothetical protein
MIPADPTFNVWQGEHKIAVYLGLRGDTKETALEDLQSLGFPYTDPSIRLTMKRAKRRG